MEIDKNDKEISGRTPTLTSRESYVRNLFTFSPKTKERCQYFLENCPILCLFYDLFFDESPDIENVKEMLNLFGLISTLMLAILVDMAGSVSYEEMESADEMCMNKNYTTYSPYYHHGNIYANMWYARTNRFYSPDYSPSIFFNRAKFENLRWTP